MSSCRRAASWVMSVVLVASSTAVGEAALSGRPCEMSSTQKMQMHVKYRLPRIFVGVDDCTIPARRNSFILRDLCRRKRQLSYGGGVSRFVQGGDVLRRGDENMRRRLWIDVSEGHDAVFVVEERDGNLLFHDPTEQTVVSH